jgi:hypothetical protein
VGKTASKAHLKAAGSIRRIGTTCFFVFVSAFVVVFVIWFLFLATAFALKGRDFSPAVPALLLVWI